MTIYDFFYMTFILLTLHLLSNSSKTNETNRFITQSDKCEYMHGWHSFISSFLFWFSKTECKRYQVGNSSEPFRFSFSLLMSHEHCCL